MSFLNMRLGASRGSELMATAQECSNWGLALISGQTTTLLNLSSEENNTSIGCLGVYWEATHLFSFSEPRLSDGISIWLDGLCLHYFLLEKVRARVKLTVMLSVSWPIGSVIHITKHSTVPWLHCAIKSLLSFCLFCTCSSLVIKYCDPWDECNGFSCGPLESAGPSHGSVLNAARHHQPKASFEGLQATLWVNLLLSWGL